MPKYGNYTSPHILKDTLIKVLDGDHECLDAFINWLDTKHSELVSNVDKMPLESETGMTEEGQAAIAIEFILQDLGVKEYEFT